MPKSLATIQQQIKKLQEQADVLKRKEAIGVIAKIKTAIDFYGLTAADLFDETPASTTGRGKSISNASTLAGVKQASPKKVSLEKKAPKPPKFTDGTHAWSGHGKRPQWFKDAVESGKTPEELAVKTD